MAQHGSADDTSGGRGSRRAGRPGAPPAPCLWRSRPPLLGGLGAPVACGGGLVSLGWVALVLQGAGRDVITAVREASSEVLASPSRGGNGPGAGLGPGLFRLSPRSPGASAWALGSRPPGSAS